MRPLLTGVLLMLCTLGCRPSVPTKATATSSPTLLNERTPLTDSIAVPASETASDEGQTRQPSPQGPDTTLLPVSESQIAVQKVQEEGHTASVELASGIAQPKWTVQRIVILARGGPRIIELRVNIAGLDLPTGLAAALQALATELGIDWAMPPTWDLLLKDTLVQSGWLGNLVPTEQQRAQLLTLYDTDANGLVADSEFRAFITRGMVRNPPLRVIHGTAPAQSSASISLWGPLDENADSALSEAELKRTAELLQSYDYDGDRIITQAEVQSANDAAMGQQMARSRDLLDATDVLVLDAQNAGRIVTAIFDHYTFTDSIDATEFSAWSQQQLASVDTNNNLQISKQELHALATLEPDAVLSCTYPNAVDEQIEQAHLLPAETSAGTWISSSLGGRLNLPDCVLSVVVRDDHNSGQKSYVEQLLRSALDDSQVSTMLSAQLELKEGAFDLLRSRGEEAIEVGWRWTVAPRDWHATVSWSAQQKPWFELIDANGDQRLTENEVARFADSALMWDRDAGGTLEVNEVPLVIRLEMSRIDRRGPFVEPGGPASQKRGANALSAPAWFLGMDYNSDGEITPAEFLGAEADFARLDTDGSGEIDAREVYTPR